jgi:hypothetical protein
VACDHGDHATERGRAQEYNRSAVERQNHIPCVLSHANEITRTRRSFFKPFLAEKNENWGLYWAIGERGKMKILPNPGTNLIDFAQFSHQ